MHPATLPPTFCPVVSYSSFNALPRSHFFYKVFPDISEIADDSCVLLFELLD